MNKIILLMCALMLSLTSFAFPGTQEVTAEIIDDQVVVSFNIPDKMHQVLQKEYFKLEIEPVDGLDFGPTEYPAGIIKGKFGDEYHGLTQLKQQITVSGDFKQTTLNVNASYQLCNETGACLMPQDISLKVTIPQSLTVESADDEGSELPYMLVLAFCGGLILNLMPCVLPVLSIKMMSIVNSAQKGRHEIMMGGLTYTAGVLVSFAFLAGAVIALKTSGEAVGWGFQFQNPYFVFGLLVIIWAFGLSLFDLFLVQAPGMNAATKASSSNGAMGTFMSGVFAVLLATPCTAPMLGSAIGFAFKQSSAIIFLMMMVVGLGLAFPFILLGFMPGVMKLVPKPGNWMNSFREVMGFLLFATAVFLARSLSFIISPAQFINVLWFMLILSFALWLYGRNKKPHLSKTKQWLGTIAAAIIALYGAYALLDFSYSEEKQSTSEVSSSNWQVFSTERLEKLKADGKGVFVDFGAEWCMTCKANEALVLNTDDIQAAFKEKGVELLHGDFTRKNPVILEYLQKYERGGVPLYLYFKKGESEPIIFPEVLTKGMIRDALK